MTAIDSLRLHPDAERVPMASADDLASLRASLQENGQQDPIDITPDGLILDGRTRWMLLRELGAKTIQTRIVDVPAGAQTTYIVDRAVARRHLTTDQKRALNALLRKVVDEVISHPVTKEEVRIGRGQTQRAEQLGVTRETVRQWDAEESPARNLAGEMPTHQRINTGRIIPIHPEKPEPAQPKARPDRRVPPPPQKRVAPSWVRYFTIWCRSTRPEDRDLLLRLDKQLHEAFEMNDLTCEH